MIRIPTARIETVADFGPILDDLLETHRISQRALVEAAGGSFTRAQLYLWIVGKTAPSLAGLIKLVQALGYDLALVPREDAQ